MNKQVEHFMKSFENHDIFNDTQDIHISDSVEQVDLPTFMHIQASDIIQPTDSSVTDKSIYPLIELWPSTDSTIYIGLNEGRLISYAIDTCTLSTSKYELSDLLKLIMNGCDNIIIYESLFL